MLHAYSCSLYTFRYDDDDTHKKPVGDPMATEWRLRRQGQPHQGGVLGIATQHFKAC